MTKPPSPPSKKRFFDLLERVVHKGEKSTSETKKYQKSGDYNDKKTRQHKTDYYQIGL